VVSSPHRLGVLGVDSAVNYAALPGVGSKVLVGSVLCINLIEVAHLLQPGRVCTLLEPDAIQRLAADRLALKAVTSGWTASRSSSVVRTPRSRISEL